MPPVRQTEKWHKPANQQSVVSRVLFVRTCSDASVGQVRGDCDPPAFIHTHALKTAVHPRDEPAQAHLADEGSASVMAADGSGEVGESV